MKRNKKTIKLAGFILASLILIITTACSKDDTESLEKQLKDIAVEYYENDFAKNNPNFLKLIGELRIDLDGLKGMEKDISVFEDKNCDMEDTYVTLTYKEDSSYDTTVHLACDKE